MTRDPSIVLAEPCTHAGTIQSSSPLTVASSEEQWAYALSIPVQVDSAGIARGRAHIVVDVTVDSGHLGVLLVADDWTTLLAPVTPDLVPGRHHLQLMFEREQSGHLVFRNNTEGDSSCVFTVNTIDGLRRTTEEIAHAQRAVTPIGPNRLAEYRGRRLLCVTNSDRPHEADKCDLNLLTVRYSTAGRLPPKEPFSSLRPLSDYRSFGGAVTIYDIGDDGAAPPALVCAFRPVAYKPQQCIWHEGLLWVVGEGQVEVYDTNLQHVTEVLDPWLAGGHTIAPDGNGCMLVTCSGSDSVLWIDIASRSVVRAVRLPEAIYGHNYPLSRSDSVVDHYVVNDFQLTHVNCAWPWRGGVLTSSLIPGAIGWIDPAGHYRELLRGLIGCHGVRARADRDELYFCDSCSGILVFTDADGRIVRRVNFDSHWLHDAVQVSGELFAAARYDRREVLLWDVAAWAPRGSIDCAAFGFPQFLWFGR